LDIGGYSSMCESLDDERVNFLVEKYFSEFLDDVKKGTEKSMRRRDGS